MSTREVERELVTLLHRRAEGAMSSTDTQTEHEKFHEVLEAGGHRDRGPRTFLAAGAAAAAVVIGGVWSSGFGDDGPVRPPTPASTPTSTERFALRRGRGPGFREGIRRRRPE